LATIIDITTDIFTMEFIKDRPNYNLLRRWAEEYNRNFEHELLLDRFDNEITKLSGRTKYFFLPPLELSSL
jgi:hypothetical protein